MTSPTEQETQTALLDDIADSLHSIKDTLEMLAWRSLPFWRRWAIRWQEAHDVIKQTEDDIDRITARADGHP